MSQHRGHGRTTRRFRRLAAQLRAQGLECSIRSEGCRGIDYDVPWWWRTAFTVDHILPLSTYPELAEEPTNLRPACRWCNGSKGARAAPRSVPDLGRTSRQW